MLGYEPAGELDETLVAPRKASPWKVAAVLLGTLAAGLVIGQRFGSSAARGGGGGGAAVR